MNPIGYHLTVITGILGLSVNFTRCDSEEQVLEKAKEWTKNYDPMEVIVGCLTIYDDGNVSHSQFTLDELTES